MRTSKQLNTTFKMNKNAFYILISILIFTSCSKENTFETEGNTNTETPIEVIKKPNILLIIADDMGLDASPNYTVGSIKPNLPIIENLVQTGITFNNVWSNPTCSPTRATILTGKYGFNTGVLKVDDELSTSETSLQKYLDTQLNSTYSSAVIGKWHLSKDANHPNNIGLNYYAGSIGGGLKNYWDWDLVINGEKTPSTYYNTSKYTDLAIDWVNNQSDPWFLWLAYNAPHTPFHLPPTNLHTQGELPTDDTSINTNPLPYYLASIEAMDSEIGRLLNEMSTEEKDNTVIIFIGDNGTPNQVVQEYDSRRAKGSIYQGGINVPMIISGKNVNRFNEIENSLINTTDLFATIANIAGVQVDEINDSKNFIDLFSNSEVKIRDYVYAETENDITIRNSTHKYLLFQDGSEALYDLSNDPFETKNLMSSRNLPLSEQDDLIKEELITKLGNLKN